jgi:uncharacterized spore protein YtfJ
MDQNLNLTQNVDSLFANIENFTQTEGIIGKPVTHENKTFIPVVSVSIGYGGGNTGNKNQTGTTTNQGTTMSGGALGAGAKLTTDAIIVIDEGKVSMMTLNATANASQIMDKIPEVIKGMNQNQNQNQQQNK